MSDAFREHVELADPDPAWPHWYAEEEARIRNALGGLEPIVEHIGSTSVPVRAKPIIDIQVAVRASRVGQAVAALQALGYEHHGQGAVMGREYLTRRDAGTPPINVHLFAADNSLLDDNRIIRDYLREHPDAAAEYAAVKQRALDEGYADLLSYSHAKGDHVGALRESAYCWQRERRGS